MRSTAKILPLIPYLLPKQSVLFYFLETCFRQTLPHGIGIRLLPVHYKHRITYLELRSLNLGHCTIVIQEADKT